MYLLCVYDQRKYLLGKRRDIHQTVLVTLTILTEVIHRFVLKANTKWLVTVVLLHSVEDDR